tara:strand:+ start:63 stop:755 length:693 start_codon:yes stop_codon:yes gene_type:complete
MKLVVAGCSFSDYLEKNNNVYGENLAAFLGRQYVHEGAGSGSNWRIWRVIGNMIYNSTLDVNDILIVQYTNNERQEFWSQYAPGKKQMVNGKLRRATREPGPEDGSIIKYKSQSYTWHGEPYPKEGKFLKQYEERHVSEQFAQEQFDAHHTMFMAMLRDKKIRTIFLRSRINPNFKLDQGHEFNSFKESDGDLMNEEYYYEPQDSSHLNDKGHLHLAKKLNKHIKELGWK